MKKNAKTIKAFIELVKGNESKKAKAIKMLQNEVSEDARKEVQAVIDECQATIDALKAAIDELEAAEGDHSEELLAKLKELQDKQTEVENKLNANKNALQVCNFLESKESRKEFLKVVKNSVNADEFRKNWSALLVQNGITPTDLMLPAAVVSEISDAWESGSKEFLNFLDITGLKVWKGAINTSNQDAPTSRAGGHKAGKQKQEEVLVFTTVTIRAAYIYKYITIDREMLEDDENGILAVYLAREMALQLFREIMRAVLIGDGRADNAEGKITSFEAITAATAVASGKTTMVDAAKAIPTRAEVRDAIIKNIKVEGDRIAVMSEATFAALAEYVMAQGGTSMWASKEELAAQLGVREIFTTNLLDAESTAEVKAPKVIVFVGKAYKVVGDLNIEGFENFVLAYNKKEFLSELRAGGALGLAKSAVVINAPLVED